MAWLYGDTIPTCREQGDCDDGGVLLLLDMLLLHWCIIMDMEALGVALRNTYDVTKVLEVMAFSSGN